MEKKGEEKKRVDKSSIGHFELTKKEDMDHEDWFGTGREEGLVDIYIHWRL